MIRRILLASALVMICVGFGGIPAGHGEIPAGHGEIPAGHAWAAEGASIRLRSVSILDLLKTLQFTTGMTVLLPSVPNALAMSTPDARVTVLGELDLSKEETVRALLAVQGYELDQRVLEDGAEIISVKRTARDLFAFEMSVLVVPGTTDLDRQRDRALRALLERARFYRTIPPLRLATLRNSVLILGSSRVMRALEVVPGSAPGRPAKGFAVLCVVLVVFGGAAWLRCRKRSWAGVALIGVVLGVWCWGRPALTALQPYCYTRWQYYSIHDRAEGVVVNRERSRGSADAAVGSKSARLLPGPDRMVRLWGGASE